VTALPTAHSAAPVPEGDDSGFTGSRKEAHDQWDVHVCRHPWLHCRRATLAHLPVSGFNSCRGHFTVSAAGALIHPLGSSLGMLLFARPDKEKPFGE
jgi:hypothetical protein